MEHHFFHLFGEILSFIALSETVTHFNWQRETDNELEYLCRCLYHLQRYFAVKNLFLMLIKEILFIEKSMELHV